MKHYILMFWMVTWLISNLVAQDYNIIDFGANADGKTLNTFSIQSAIETAYKDGGGRVIIPAGVFLSGTIHLKTGVSLHLDDHATLLGSTSPSDYDRISYWKALIMAHNAKNISISGNGHIDGQGRALALHVDSLFYANQVDSSKYNFVEMRPKEYLRPVLIQFKGCENIKVKDINLLNASSWVQIYERCNGIEINGIKVVSDAYWNNDGIDIVDSRNVQILNCNIDSADDGICLKSHHPDYYCDSIIVSNCTVRSSASAIKFGTKSLGGFKNVLIQNIKVYDTFRSAIAIESVDGGFLENILVENIIAKNTGNAIFIKLGKRETERAVGSLKNVILRNISVEVAYERPDYAYDIRGPALPFFHNIFPSSITGIPGYNIEHVILENIEITYPGRGNKGLAYAPLSRLDDVPENASDYPEFSMFGELPAWGFYVRHVDGLVFRNIKLHAAAEDYRPAVVLDNVKNMTINALQINGKSKDKQIILHHTENIKTDDTSLILGN